MFQVLGMVMPLFTLILLGYLSGRIRKLPLEGLSWLNFFVLYVSLPALFFRLLSRTPIEEFANGQFLAHTTLATFLVFALCFTLARLLKRGDTQAATIQGFAGAYGNIGYLGPPLAIAAFGPAAAVPVALIFCLDNTMHFTLAPLLMSLGNQQKKKPLAVVGEILKRVFTHPFILATLAGVIGAWYQYVPPQPIDQLLVMLSGAAAPCALFAMGVTAALRPLKRIPVELNYLVPIKLVVHPLIMYVLVTQIPGVPVLWVHAAVLLAALPSATNVFIIAQQYNVWVERASSAVVISTVFSTFTVTVYIYLATNGYL